MRLVLIFVLLFVFPPSAFAQNETSKKSAIDDVFARGCGDDRGVDRCDRSEHQRMRQLYGMNSPDELLKQGVTVRRAMFVDGYGNDVAAVSFIRRPNVAPMVEVRAPIREGQKAGQPLLASLSAETWAGVIAKSRFFDRMLAPEKALANRDISSDIRICLHGWFVVVEAVDAPRVSPNVLAGTGSVDMERDPSLPVKAPMDPGLLRHASQSACADGLANAFAFELADIARAALTECSTLEVDDFRNVPELLRRCHLLEGDRLAAGEAQNVINKLNQMLRTKNKQELEWLFVGLGPARAKAFEAAIGKGLPDFSVTHGVDADHARVAGQVIYFDSDGNPAETADLSLNLLRQVGTFVIDSFAVTNRKPFKAAVESNRR